MLGSTGSIGRQTLEVIARHPDRFLVTGLAAGANAELVREQAQRFGVSVVTTAADGPGALLRAALDGKPDLIVAATDGAVAFDAVFAAVDRGIDIAVANKELIVGAGELLMAHAARSGSRILPIDSEHSAIFQCLQGAPRERVASIVLTASGGPFWDRSAAQMADATVADALAHPTWSMGVKNTIDSATLMNKGLEVIEAARLFGLPGERIAVVVHRTSVAHGFVIFTDGNVIGQLAAPDMRLPIGYALAYPDRLDDRPIDDPIAALGGERGSPATTLAFERPDPARFPALGLAYAALAAGGTAPAALSAANEIAVAAFVEGSLRFGDIAACIETVLAGVDTEEATLTTIRAADRSARTSARTFIASRAVGNRRT